jgi:hypothetical protein
LAIVRLEMPEKGLSRSSPRAAWRAELGKPAVLRGNRVSFAFRFCFPGREPNAVSLLAR